MNMKNTAQKNSGKTSSQKTESAKSKVRARGSSKSITKATPGGPSRAKAPAKTLASPAKRDHGSKTERAAAIGRAPLAAKGSPPEFRARVRMYRQGLGDCLLITFPRADGSYCNILIDCGALARDSQFMTQIVEHLRDTVRGGTRGKAKLDVVVATHEHKDHLSGFNQARAIFDNDFEFGSVWMGWTENLSLPEIKKIKETRRKIAAKLTEVLHSPAMNAAPATLAGLDALLQLNSATDEIGQKTIAQALEYLKQCGEQGGGVKFLEPGESFALEGVEGVNVYVLGPPTDPILLKSSEVTKQHKNDEIIYHLSAFGENDLAAISAGISGAGGDGAGVDRYHPFAEQHRIKRLANDGFDSGTNDTDFPQFQRFFSEHYCNVENSWRTIDGDWLTAFSYLALDLDSDTNNTSLVLAFEFEDTKEVLLFVGDAQVGNWQSWDNVTFDPGVGHAPIPAHDLLKRAVFYKVGHHCSHNATLKKGGLELMTHSDLVAFIPLDKATAAKQGKKDPVTGKTKGWDMPAMPLYKALQEKTNKRVAISDVKETLSAEAKKAGVLATDIYVDYFLK